MHINRGSFNGRTTDSESVNRGSNPCPRAACYNDSDMSDNNPPIGEIAQSPEVQLDPKQKVVQAFLDQYTATFDSLSLDVPDDDNLLLNYFSKLDTSPFLSPQELVDAEITIFQKRSDKSDDIRIANGDHPGVFISITTGNKAIQINAWGGLRDLGDTVNYQDSRTANLKGGGHAARTNAIMDEPFRVNFQTFVNDNLQDKLQLTLRPNNAKVVFGYINGKKISGDEGEFMFTQQRVGAQGTPVPSILPKLMSELKTSVTPILPLIRGNRNFDSLVKK